LNETQHNDNDEIFNVMGSKIKVIDNIFRKCTFLAKACRTTVRRTVASLGGGWHHPVGDTLMKIIFLRLNLQEQ